MIRGFETEIDIEGEPFDELRLSINAMLKRLVKDMVEKGSTDGKVSVSIGVELTRQYVQNVLADATADDREVIIPRFKYKVGSAMQIKDSIGGEKDYDGMELVWDEDKGEYIIVPIAEAAQQSIWDADYEEYFQEADNKQNKAAIGADNNLITNKNTESDTADTEGSEEYF